jgi:dihydroorotase
LAQKKRTERQYASSGRNLLVKDANIWTGEGFTRGSVLIENGAINRIARKVDAPGVEIINASGLYALPGMIDVHVHLRDMLLSYKEDFASGTAAAAAGGFTTVLDMPNTVPPTDSVQRLIEKQKRAARETRVNVGFHTAATSEKKVIGGLAEAGAFSIKLYMPKPIAPFDVNDDAEIQKMMTGAGRIGIPVTVHAEEMERSEKKGRIDDIEQLVRARPPIIETRAVNRIASIRKRTRCRVHFCHLTLASSLGRVRAGSPRTTSEVTPHHLLLSTKMLKKLGWKAWMVPPLRSERNRRALLSATRAGYCDIVASDHAPHTIGEKKLGPEDSPPGVPGLETTLSLMLTLVNKGILNFALLTRMMAEGPARIFGLRSKARLRPGFDGDLVLVDRKKKSRIDSSRFLSKAKFSPFDGFPTKGGVVSTIVGGTLVYDDGELWGKEGSGAVLRSNFSE